MTVKEYAAKYGITQQATMKHLAKGRWLAGDGAAYAAYRKGRRWVIEEEPAAPGLRTAPDKTVTPDSLKAKKTLEEIKLLQNRNEKMRAELMHDWSRCLYRAASGLYGAMASRLMALRLDKDLAKKIDAIIQEEAASLESRMNAEVEQYEDENRVRLR